MNMNNSTSQDLINHNDRNEHNFDDLDDYYRYKSHCLYVINAILSGTARLNVLLPTVIVLAFAIFVPLLTNNGECSTLNRRLTVVFMAVSAVSCVFFSFTDSFRTTEGRWYYGVATLRGIWTFNCNRTKPRMSSAFRLRWDDLFHATRSLVTFLAFAGLNQDVVRCYYPGLSRKVTNILLLVVGFIVSFLLVEFPSRRRGIGNPFLLQRDPLYSRH